MASLKERESAGSPAWRLRCQVGISLHHCSSTLARRLLFGVAVSQAKAWAEAPDDCQGSRRSILCVSGRPPGRGRSREPRTRSGTVAVNPYPGNTWRWRRSSRRYRQRGVGVAREQRAVCYNTWKRETGCTVRDIHWYL